MESVEQDFKVWVGLKEILDECKVKDFLEHSNIILDRINDFNRQIPVLFRPNFREVDLTRQYLTAKCPGIRKEGHMKAGRTSGISAILYSLICFVIW